MAVLGQLEGGEHRSGLYFGKIPLKTRQSRSRAPPVCMSAASRAHRRAWVSGGVWWRQRPLALVSVLRGGGRGVVRHMAGALWRARQVPAAQKPPPHTPSPHEHRQPGPRSCMGEVVIVNVASSPRPYQRDQRPCGGGTARVALRLACVLGLGVHKSRPRTPRHA